MFIFFFSEKRIFKNYNNYLWIYIFIIFWIYIVVNSYLTENNFRSLQSAISQIRFLILALAIGFFFQLKALSLQAYSLKGYEAFLKTKGAL